MSINPGKIIVELQDTFGNDRSVAEAAWTSSTTRGGKELKTDEQVADLVRRLARDGHSVPFESIVLRFWMRIPIFVDRQIMTHRLASHNGMSGRYRTMPDDYYTLPDDVIEICERVGSYWPLDSIEINYRALLEKQADLYRDCLDNLKKLRDVDQIVTPNEYKRVREVLRGVLGTAFMTERVSQFNLRAWANFVRLRNSEHAQPEIRQVAEQMLTLVKEANVCPVAIEALEANDWRI